MAENNVSKPPLQAKVVDSNGLMAMAWSSWFRDLYRRTSYKGSNAIDDNKAAVDEELLSVNASLSETVEQVNDNTSSIASISQSVSDVEQSLSDHEALEQAHGSNGNIVGFEDLATEAVVGLVNRMQSVELASYSTATITTDDIGDAPSSYDQTYTQSVTDLTNENKAAINQAIADLNSLITKFNNLVAYSKAAGQMTE